jgi:enoyl-CoA hydratase
MSDELRIEQKNRVMQITINRPEDKNRVSSAMAIQLAEALDGASKTSELVLLRANGDEFCHGWTGPGKGVTFAGMQPAASLEHYDVVFNCYNAFRRSRVPVIGLVQSAARGFGCALASSCDITIASDTALFQIPEMSHDILPTMVLWSMHDRVSYKALAYLAYTAAEIDAQAAMAAGIVSRVVPASKLQSTADETCAFLLSRPRAAVIGLKEYLRSAPNMDGQGALDFGRNLHATVNTSLQKPR